MVNCSYSIYYNTISLLIKESMKLPLFANYAPALGTRTKIVSISRHRLRYAGDFPFIGRRASRSRARKGPSSNVWKHIVPFSDSNLLRIEGGVAKTAFHESKCNIPRLEW